LGHIIPNEPPDLPSDFAERVRNVLKRTTRTKKFGIGGVVTAVRVGNSLMVVIPAGLVKKKHFKAGDRFIALANDFGLVFRRIRADDTELTKLFGEPRE